MGFVATIFFHPAFENGKFGYDMEKVEEKTLRIGARDEDVDHAQLATILLKQLSRRDVLVCDVKVVEFVKRSLKIKNSKDGIIIGGKKFSFGENTTDASPTVSEVNENGEPVNQPAPPQQAPQPRRALRREFFNPDPNKVHILAEQYARYGLTVGQSYEIVGEVGLPGLSSKYRVINNFGKEVIVPDSEFSAVPPGGAGLYSDGVVDEGQEINDIPLSYGNGQYTNDMPVLRRS